jgi:hypothetical protein
MATNTSFLLFYRFKISKEKVEKLRRNGRTRRTLVFWNWPYRRIYMYGELNTMA